jgi:hypothetical protein
MKSTNFSDTRSGHFETDQIVIRLVILFPKMQQYTVGDGDIDSHIAPRHRLCVDKTGIKSSGIC